MKKKFKKLLMKLVEHQKSYNTTQIFVQEVFTMSGTMHNSRTQLDADKIKKLKEENKNIQKCFEIFD